MLAVTLPCHSPVVACSYLVLFYQLHVSLQASCFAELACMLRQASYAEAGDSQQKPTSVMVVPLV